MSGFKSFTEAADQSATLSKADLEAAFAKLNDQAAAERRARRQAAFDEAWAKAFPDGYDRYTPEEIAFLARMWAAGHSGEAVAPRDNRRLGELAFQAIDPAVVLARATRPLLELFATVDTVFSEADALDPERRQVSLGRIYRAWKQARAEIDR